MTESTEAKVPKAAEARGLELENEGEGYWVVDATTTPWSPPTGAEGGPRADSGGPGRGRGGTSGPDCLDSPSSSKPVCKSRDASRNQHTVTLIARLLDDNDAYATARASVNDAVPGRRLAVLTCMDARIDVFAVLGLHLGEAHVLRNAGGRVTDDVLRSLALSVHVFGIATVVVMQHTRCGLAGVSDEELRGRTGADLGFFPIEDHAAALREDIELLGSTPYLEPLAMIAGFVYDVESGRIDDVVRWTRPVQVG